jgi:Zn-dependent protease with chaperone function/uncharacterized tellurite resistance protein B-like protein
MNYDLIRLPLEKQLGTELYNTLEGDILNDIMAEGKVEGMAFDYHRMLQGHSFKASAQLAPGLYGIFQEVVETLEFTEPLEFYINNSPELNAFAVASLTPDKPHIINVNSGLIEKLTDRELRFVVGHEVGHLISRNASIATLINFVYPNPGRMPVLLQHKISLWEKMSELTADRFGYIACNDLQATISGFFKIASGLFTERVKLDYQAYLEENERILEIFRQNGAGNNLSHPINPIRIKAVQLYAASDLHKNVYDEAVEDKTLEAGIAELTRALLVLGTSPLDHYRKQFVATAGLILANVDSEINDEEYETILNTLSNFTIFPLEYLDSIVKSGKVSELFTEAISKILEINPSDRFAMLNMLISLAHSDRRISRNEIAFMFEAGTQLMGMSRKEIAQLIAENIQQGFNPDLFGGE